MSPSWSSLSWGATHLIIRLKVHVCEVQQLPKLGGLVVVEHGLLGGGKGGQSEVRWTLLPDGRKTGLRARGNGSSHSIPLVPRNMEHWIKKDPEDPRRESVSIQQ